MLVVGPALENNNYLFFSLLLEQNATTGSPSCFSSLHHTFPVQICKYYFFLRPHPCTESHPIISEQLCWQSNAWMSTPTVWEEKMWCHLFCEMFVCHWFFCFALSSAATARLQAQFQLYQTWHLWCNSNSQTGEGRNAAVHMSRVPLYAGAKPIIHVEICLGKLGSTLENKQPETGELHWGFRATLMCCRLMEALPCTQTYC